MVHLVPLLQSTQDGNSVRHAWLVNQHTLETTLQGFVLLKILLILSKCRSTDGTQLTTRQCRLQYVGCIHCTLTATGTDQRVDLVDEKNNLAVGLVDFTDDTLQTLLELALVFSTCYKCTHIKRIERLRLQVLRHIATHNTMRNAFGNSRLAHAWLTDKNRVVLGSTAQNLQHTPYLIVTANDRVKLAALCQLVKVARIFIQSVESVLCRLTAHLATLAQIGNGGTKSLVRCTGILQQSGRIVTTVDKPYEQMLDRHKLVAHLRSRLLRPYKGIVQVVACILASTTYTWQRLYLGIQSLRQPRHINLHLLQQIRRNILVLAQKPLHQMHGVDARRLMSLSNLGGLLNRLLSFNCKIV